MPQSKKKPTDPDYDVGYARPPKSGQFKPGQSGNPKGRTKGARGVTAIFKAVSEQKIEVHESGGVRTYSWIEALLRQSYAQAFKGDAKATANILSMAKTSGMIAPDENKPDPFAEAMTQEEDLAIMNRILARRKSPDGE